MNTGRFILTFGAILLLACGARADLSTNWSHESSAPLASVKLLLSYSASSSVQSERFEPVNVVNTPIADTASLLWAGVGVERGSHPLAFAWGGVGYDLGRLQSDPLRHTGGAVRQLPAGPGSAELFLSAMLTVGVWQLTRASVRHLKLASVPDWFHAEGPTQVGHAIPFDFDFTTLPPCSFAQPVGQRSFLYRVRREHAPRRDSQSFLTIAAPRGPPVLA